MDGHLLWEALPVALIIFAAAYGLANQSRLPERVPIHFNAAGEPDNWMGRSGAIWLAPAFALAFYIAGSFYQGHPLVGGYVFAFKTILIFFMANTQVVTVLYATDRIKSPLLGILPSIVILCGFAIWFFAAQGMAQAGKG